MKYSFETNVGMVRNENQDYCDVKVLSEDAFLFTVCDGMGGRSGGKIASKTATDIFTSHFNKRYSNFLKTSKNIGNISPRTVKNIIKHALTLANKEIQDISKEDAQFAGMGTTLVSAFVTTSKIYVTNVGDSRLYFVTDNCIKQITKDHSYVQYLVDMNKITIKEAQKHPNKNIITRAVGTDSDVSPDIFIINREAIDDTAYLLLATDGLTNNVSDEILHKVITSSYSTLDEKVRALIDNANKAGGSDNITACIVEL